MAAVIVGLLLGAIVFKQATTISNGLGEDNVDISKWVLSNGLKKVSAVHLINPHPNWLDDEAFAKLQKMFAESYPTWKFPASSLEELKRRARYQYTHVPGYNPVDVYALPVEAAGKLEVVYFQVNPDGRLFPMIGTEPPAGPPAAIGLNARPVPARVSSLGKRHGVSEVEQSRSEEQGPVSA